MREYLLLHRKVLRARVVFREWKAFQCDLVTVLRHCLFSYVRSNYKKLLRWN